AQAVHCKRLASLDLVFARTEAHVETHLKKMASGISVETDEGFQIDRPAFRVGLRQIPCDERLRHPCAFARDNRSAGERFRMTEELGTALEIAPAVGLQRVHRDELIAHAAAGHRTKAALDVIEKLAHEDRR